MELLLPGKIKIFLKKEDVSKTEFVERMGYRNQNKGMRRLQSWLTGEGRLSGDQLKRLASALKIEETQLRQIITSDENELKKRAAIERAQDPKYYLTIRIMAAFYISKTLPSDLTPEQAMRVAVKEAKSKGLRCCLNTPENKNYFLDAKGKLEQVTSGPRPYMEISGNAFRLAVVGE